MAAHHPQVKSCEINLLSPGHALQRCQRFACLINACDNEVVPEAHI